MALSTPAWCSPPDPVPLPLDTIHLWRVDLRGSEGQIQELSQVLSPDEQERAQRYHFQRDRRRFILSRGQLRVLLGRYLDAEPRSIRFDYGPRGKPSLEAEGKPSDLGFNVSHSQDLALMAFVWGRSVGVDLEYMRPMSDLEQLSQRFFSPQEHGLICAHPSPQRLEAFFRLWTAKEACLKALGEGLIGLEGTEVSLTETGVNLVRLRSQTDPDQIGAWGLQQWVPAPGFMATLATPEPIACSFWQLIAARLPYR